ncbi:MAG: hypothetical protein ACI8RZ_006206, partial [Myxococcota bacterium]
RGGWRLRQTARKCRKPQERRRRPMRATESSIAHMPPKPPVVLASLVVAISAVAINVVAGVVAATRARITVRTVAVTVVVGVSSTVRVHAVAPGLAGAGVDGGVRVAAVRAGCVRHHLLYNGRFMRSRPCPPAPASAESGS